MTFPITTDLNDSQRAMIRLGKSSRVNSRLSIPRRYYDKGLMDFNDAPFVEKARATLVGGKGLFLYGQCGTGKTHLAVGLLLDWYADHYGAKALFQSCPEMFFKIKDGFSRNQSEESVLNSFGDIDLLVLDDLGAEKLSEWSREVFYILIDRIYRNNQQVIITGNLSMKDVAVSMDARIASRIGEMADIIKLDGKDRRIANAAHWTA